MNDTTTMQAVRPVTALRPAQRHMEGAGFPVRRPFPAPGLDQVDPFLMLDEVGPVDWPPGKALGAPDHPHRGFETITYVLQGRKMHEDSTGAVEALGPGDVQWMTAGAGIVHAELPTPEFRASGGRAHSFQIWVNLPARDKWVPARYQCRRTADIPTAESADGLARVKVIAGKALGVTASITTHTPVTLLDLTIEPGGALAQPVPAGHNAALYVFAGSLLAGAPETEVPDGRLAVFGEGETVGLRVDAAASGPARALLLAGSPLNEPVARYGPFVMNTREEVIAAVHDFQAGRMGEIRRA